MYKKYYESIQEELEVLYNIASFIYPESEEELIKEVEKKVKEIFGARYFALYLRSEKSLRLASFFGFKNPEEIKEKIEEEKPNQFYSLLGKDGELGVIFIEEEHPINEKRRLIYDIYVKQLENALLTIKKLHTYKRSGEIQRVFSHQMELLLNSTGEGIIRINLDGDIIFANQAAARMTGYRNEELINQSIFKTLYYSKPNKVPIYKDECLIYSSMKIGLTHYTDTECFWRKDGTNFPVEFTSAPIKEDGKITGVVVIFRDITKQKATDDELRAIKERLIPLIYYTPDIITILDLKRRIIQVNPAFEQLYGWSEKEVLGKKIPVVPSYLRKATQKLYREVIEGKNTSDYETKRQKKDGTLIDASVTLSPIKDSTGKVVAISDITRDITEKKQLKEKLLSSEKRYRELFENTLEGVYKSTLDGKLIAVNPALVEMLGYESEEELLSADISNELYANPEDRKAHSERMKKDGEMRNVEVVLKRKDGSKFVALKNSLLVYDEHNKVLYHQGSIIDITRRKVAEEELRTIKDRLESLINNTTDVIVIIDLEGRVMQINPAFEKTYGWTTEEVIERKLPTIPEYLIEDTEELLKKIREGAVLTGYETKRQKKDGTLIDVSMTISPIKDVGGRVIAISSITRDISERIEREEELRTTKEKLESLINNSADAITIRDLQGNILEMNPAFEKIYGWTKKDVIEKKTDIIPDYLIPESEELVRKVVSGEIVSAYQTKRLRKDGAMLDISLTLSPIRDSSGNITAISGISRDITRYKEVERNILLRDSILEAVSFAAHEFLKAASWEENIQKILEHLGKATDVSRVYIFENYRGEDGTIYTNQRYEWVTPGITPQINNPDLQNFAWERGPLRYWVKNLSQEKPVYGHIRELPSNGKEFLSEEDIKSILVMPVFVEGKWWGIMGFDECLNERDWSQLEIEALKTASNLLGSAIQRSQGYNKLRKTLDDIVNAMVVTTEIRDPYTAGHQKRVSQLACAIGRLVELPENMIEAIRISSLLHDSGKFNIPTEILAKPRKLNEVEFNIIKSHCEAGYNILKNIDFQYPVATIILQHHEKLDGSGYPKGLKTNRIMFESKILTVADVVEAMMSHRPYRPALGIDDALKEINQNKGVLYDPEVVDACVTLFTEKGFTFAE